ncbi:hypothetical protein BpHYR1_035064 [Brachionus plicatilis]|uniref:Uncharacterized protein n=1 Tax=Brachionus plicatilis TaxID=10195 RepID=A0A3M7SZ64_BRAPC|nr:hypothetical protein BpHYR1_035064 [Brachionus plicatilis]
MITILIDLLSVSCSIVSSSKVGLAKSLDLCPGISDKNQNFKPQSASNSNIRANTLFDLNEASSLI